MMPKIYWQGVLPEYKVRFMRECDIDSLVNLYHLARTAIININGAMITKYDRKIWACKAFMRERKIYACVCSETGVYKDLCGLLE